MAEVPPSREESAPSAAAADAPAAEADKVTLRGKQNQTNCSAMFSPKTFSVLNSWFTQDLFTPARWMRDPFLISLLRYSLH